MKHIKKFESEEYVPKFINTKPNLEEDNENEYPEFSQYRELKSDYLSDIDDVLDKIRVSVSKLRPDGQRRALNNLRHKLTKFEADAFHYPVMGPGL